MQLTLGDKINYSLFGINLVGMVLYLAYALNKGPLSLTLGFNTLFGGIFLIAVYISREFFGQRIAVHAVKTLLDVMPKLHSALDDFTQVYEFNREDISKIVNKASKYDSNMAFLWRYYYLIAPLLIAIVFLEESVSVNITIVIFECSLFIAYHAMLFAASRENFIQGQVMLDVVNSLRGNIASQNSHSVIDKGSINT